MSQTTQREGVKATDGAVHVYGLSSSESVSTVSASGASVGPPAFKVSADGAIYVRYV